MNPGTDNETALVLSFSDLVNWFVQGEKDPQQWRVGTEHEKILFRKDNLSAVPYEGNSGVMALLQALNGKDGWQPILEHTTMIGLKHPDKGSISLEPGGQFELSGAPLSDIHETYRETAEHLSAVEKAAEELGIGMLKLGMAPTFTRDDVARMPKGRYAIMTRYMPKVGTLGLDMMYRTATIQANMDFSSQSDMIRKMRVSSALQPIATALFANSPFTDGKPNGYLSMRSQIWLKTDDARTGIPDFIFNDHFSYEDYARWALDAPMYFVKRGDTYHDVAGASFRDFMNGKLEGFIGQYPTMQDWEDHVSTLFPEVRLKQYLEMRGADMGPPEHIPALSAFWVGLLYDPDNLDSAAQMVRNWKAADCWQFRKDVPVQGLKAQINGHSAQDIALDLLKLSQSGLKKRAKINEKGQDEGIYLEPLFEIAEEGITRAERMLQSYHGKWKGSLLPLFAEYAF